MNKIQSSYVHIIGIIHLKIPNEPPISSLQTLILIVMRYLVVMIKY